MAITQVIHLKQETFGLPPIIHMVQGDTGRTLKMIIDDGELPASPTATLYWMRSDLSHYSVNAWYDSDDNSFTADVSQALTQPHNTQCQLKVKDTNNLVVSTYTFIIHVQADVDGVQASQLGYSVAQLQSMIGEAYSGRFSDEARQALLTLLEHVAYTDEHGQDYLDDLEEALYPPKQLMGITAVFTQMWPVYDTDNLDALKGDLVVTGIYDDLSTEVIPSADYTLSGTLTAGTSIITVIYEAFATTFSVNVTHTPGYYTITNNLTGCTSSNDLSAIIEGGSYYAEITASSGYTLTGATVSVTMGGSDVTSSVYNAGEIEILSVDGDLVITVTAVAVTLSSISAVYTQSGTVYNTDSLDSLKSDLVVTATYSDTSTATVPSADYTLSGTLTVGTSTVTVSYGGKTTTFTVTVTKGTDYTLDALAGVTWHNGYSYDTSTGEYTSANNEHCTDKFEVQNCIYKIESTNTGDSYLRVFLWDDEDAFLGSYQINGRSISEIQMVPTYKCAIKVYNASSSDSTKVSMMPVDNRLTAVQGFDINLYDYVNVITGSGSKYELSADYFDWGSHGITNSNYTTTINNMSCVCIFGAQATGTFANVFSATLYIYASKIYLQFNASNISTLSGMQQYITDNRPVISINS